MKQKKLAIIGSGRMAWIFGKNAKEMGVETHCFSYDEHAIAREATDFFHDISIKDKDIVLQVCKDLQIDGVVATTELTIPVAAYVASKMQLNGINYEVSKVITDKVRNRRLCAGISDLHQPWFKEVKCIDELGEVKYPVIIKPTSLGGKRGISVAHNTKELEDGFAYAQETGPIENILVEEFLDGGKEYSVESLSYKGQHHIIQVTEKISSGPPHCVELGHQQPANISQEMRDTIVRVLSQGLTAIGVENGPCHTEVKIINDKVYLIEFNARPGGDHIAWPLTELSTGYPYIKGIIDVALDVFKGVNDEQLKHHYAGVYFVTAQTAYLKPLFDKCEQYDWLYWKNEVCKDLQALTHNDGYNTNFFMYYSENKKIVIEDYYER